MNSEELRTRLFRGRGCRNRILKTWSITLKPLSLPQLSTSSFSFLHTDIYFYSFTLDLLLLSSWKDSFMVLCSNTKISDPILLFNWDPIPSHQKDSRAKYVASTTKMATISAALCSSKDPLQLHPCADKDGHRYKIRSDRGQMSSVDILSWEQGPESCIRQQRVVSFSNNVFYKK